MNGESLNMLNNGEKPASCYTGGAVRRKLIDWAVFIVSLFTLMLAHPAILCWKYRWEYSHTFIDGKQLEFNGKALQLFGKFITWVLLTIVTLGIYGFWLGVNKHKWIIKHVSFKCRNGTEPANILSKKQKQQLALESMTEAQRAEYEEQLYQKKKTAHTLGICSLVLVFFMPPWALIIGIPAIVLSCMNNEKFGLRASACAVSVIATLISFLVTYLIVKLPITEVIITVAVIGAVAIVACTAAFIVSRKCISYRKK